MRRNRWYNRQHFLKLPLHLTIGRPGSPSNTQFLESPRLSIPNRTSIHSAIFARQRCMTDWHDSTGTSVHISCTRFGLRQNKQTNRPARKKTTTTELIIENQWICTSLIARYVSQRDAHFTRLLCHSTSYVNSMDTLPVITHLELLYLPLWKSD